MAILGFLKKKDRSGSGRNDSTLGPVYVKPSEKESVQKAAPTAPVKVVIKPVPTSSGGLKESVTKISNRSGGGGGSSGLYIPSQTEIITQQNAQQELNQFATQRQQILQTEVNKGNLSVNRANELLNNSIQNRVNKINRDLSANKPIYEPNYKLELRNKQPRQTFFTKVEARLAEAAEKTDKKRGKLREELSEDTQKRLKVASKLFNIDLKQKGEFTKTQLKQYKLALLALKKTGIENLRGINSLAEISLDKKVRKQTVNIVRDIFKDKEFRKAAGTAILAEGSNFGKLVKTSPSEAMIQIGGEIFLLKGISKGFRVAGKLSKNTIQGTVKVGSKVVRKSELLTNALNKGKTVLITAQKGGKVIINDAAKVSKKVLNKISPTSKFSKTNGQLIKVKTKKIPKVERKISGIKVSKKEFKSYSEALRELNKLKKYREVVKKIDYDVSPGFSKTIKQNTFNIVSQADLALLKGFSLPSTLIRRIKKLIVTVIPQKIRVDIPKLVRIGDKKATWRIQFETRTLYQNTVSYSLFTKEGKSLGTFSFTAISKKPITKFNSIQNAIKYGSNRSLIYSKKVGKDYIKSILTKQSFNKTSVRKFLTKTKVKKKKGLIKGEAITKAISKRTKGRTKRVFKVSPEVSRSKFLQTRKGKIRGLLIKTKSKPVVISTDRYRKIENAIKKFAKQRLTITQKKKLMQLKNQLKQTLPNKKDMSVSKGKALITKQKAKQINKVSKELTALKESISASSIRPEIRLRYQNEGLKSLKQIKKAKLELRNALIRKGLSKTGIALIKSTIIGLSKLEKIKKAIASAKTKSQLKSTQQASAKLSKQITDSIVRNTAIGTAPIITSIIIPKVRPFIDIRPIKDKIIKIPKIEMKVKKVPKVFIGPNTVYNVYVKSKGRILKANNKPLSRKDALNRGSYIVDNSTAVTFKIIPVGQSKLKTSITSKEKGAFAQARLREFKVKKGKKIITANRFIELKGKPRINKRGEKQGLRAAQLISKLNKMKKKKKKTKKR